MAIKILEQIMASFVMMKGTGMMDSLTMQGSTSTIVKVGAGAQALGMGAQGYSQYGQGMAAEGQAGAVTAINKNSVENSMLQMFLQQFDHQGQIDAKHAQDQFAEQSSNYTLFANLERSGNELAKVLAQQAV
jgi:hypothetical protein